MKTIRIIRDDDFWQNQMLFFLTRFYFECISEILTVGKTEICQLEIQNIL